MQVKNYTLPIPRASGTVRPVLPALPATGPQTDSAQAQLQAWRFKFVTRFRFALFCICRVQQAVIAFRGRVAGPMQKAAGTALQCRPLLQTWFRHTAKFRARPATAHMVKPLRVCKTLGGSSFDAAQTALFNTLRKILTLKAFSRESWCRGKMELHLYLPSLRTMTSSFRCAPPYYTPPPAGKESKRQGHAVDSNTTF